MGEASTGIKIAVGLLVAIGLAAMTIFIYRQASVMIKKGTSQLGIIAGDLDDTDKQIYDGMSLLGNDVISAISKYWEDDTCEIVVCTKDGANVAYNYGSNITTPFNEDLTGVPTTDAVGLPFSGKAAEDCSAAGADQPASAVAAEGKAANHAKICNALTTISGTVTNSEGATENVYLATSTGYNGTVSMGSNGYISGNSQFIGSIQKDGNGNIRRITFVQK